MKTFARRALCAFVSAVTVLLTACTVAPSVKTQTSYLYFDTVCEAKIYATEKEADAFFSVLWNTLEKYHRLYDIYHEYSGVVNLKTVNDRAGTESVEVDAEIAELLTFATEFAVLSQGKMNVAIGTLTEVWHTYREEGVSVPSREELQEAAQHTRISDLVLDAENRTVYYKDAQLKLDVGAVAKGYAAQKAYAALLAAGYTDFYLNVGGSVLCAGKKPDGSAWRIGVSGVEEAYAAVVELGDGGAGTCLVTTSSSQRYYEADGVRYHHVIDPDTLYPARNFASVTVLARDAGIADALSTALFCMNRTDGEALLSQFEGTAALWLTEDGTVYPSSDFPNGK